MRRRDHETGSPQHWTREPRKAFRELEVRTPHLNDVWRPERHRNGAGRQPVRMHEIGLTARSTAEVPQECRYDQNQPGTRTDVPHDAVPVGEPEMPERRRRHDVDLDIAFAHVLDRVGDEATRGILGPTGIGRGQNENLQRRLAKTIGSASASAMKA